MNRADRRNSILDRADIDAAMKAWQWLYARGLVSPIVCATLFRPWGLCSCGRCLMPSAPEDAE